MQVTLFRNAGPLTKAIRLDDDKPPARRRVRYVDATARR
jgi:hypothetical protein